MHACIESSVDAHNGGVQVFSCHLHDMIDVHLEECVWHLAQRLIQMLHHS